MSDRRTGAMGRVRGAGAAVLLAAVLTGCGGGAQELLDTAQLEELQNSPERARVLYERIVQEHPGSPEAQTAAARLVALGGGATK